MSKTHKVIADDSVLDSELSKMSHDEVRGVLSNEINNFHLSQFIMQHVCVASNVMDSMVAHDGDDSDCDDRDDHVIGPEVDVANAEGKGRVLVSKMYFKPGDVILRERAVVVGSWSEFHCPECSAPHKPEVCPRFCAKYSKSVRENINQIEEILADEELIGELDRARVFMKMIYQYHNNRDSVSVQRLLELQSIKFEDCLKCVQDLSRRVLIQKSGLFKDQDLSSYAKLIGIMNCNSHEIEHLGSGIFLRTSMMEHSCFPNCSFITEDHTVSIIALREIQPGELLSIDYCHAPYQPTSVRQEHHLRDYGFVCSCQQCMQLPDKVRAFHCPKKCVSNDLIKSPPMACPIGSSNVFKCINCSYQLNDAEIQVCLTAESKYHMPLCIHGEEDEEIIYEEAERKVPDFDSVAEMVNERILYDTHYIAFWSMVAIALRLTREATHMSIPHVGKGQNSKKQKAAAEKAQAERSLLCRKIDMLWQKIIQCTDISLPQYHPDKIVYHDYLGQIRVLAKDIPGAQSAWEKAYEYSCTINGEYTKNSKLLLKLHKHTPRTVEKMQFMYQNIHAVMDRIAYENDKDSAQLLTLFAESTIEMEDEAKNKEKSLYKSAAQEESSSESEDDIFAAQRKGFAATARDFLGNN